MTIKYLCYFTIQKKIRKTICEISKKENIDDNMKMIEELGFESVMIVELISRVEEEYEIEFDSFAELIEAFDTVGSVISYLVNFIITNSNIVIGG